MLTAGAQTLNNYFSITAAYNVDDIDFSISCSPVPPEVFCSKCAIHRKDPELHLRSAKAQIQVSIEPCLADSHLCGCAVWILYNSSNSI